MGLSGETIPLAARIFTIVDVWDALNADRPYRKAWSKAQAIAYMEANSGKLFDPRIVRVFLELVQDGTLPLVQEGGPGGTASANAKTEPSPHDAKAAERLLTIPSSLTHR